MARKDAYPPRNLYPHSQRPRTQSGELRAGAGLFANTPTVPSRCASGVRAQAHRSLESASLWSRTASR
eukprot:6183250-Pleurochrysis_carterae.AAC.1